MDLSKDMETFKQHIRDFLISMKEFECEDNSELFMDEKAILSAQLQMETDRMKEQSVSYTHLTLPTIYSV